MHEIERHRADMAKTGSVRPLHGGNIQWESPDWYTQLNAWELVGTKARAFTETHAGERIHDPVDGNETRIWRCEIRPEPQGGPAGTRRASYVLMVFARGGLAISTGTTGDFKPAPGETSWRATNKAYVIDPATARHDMVVDAPQQVGLADSDIPTPHGSAGPSPIGRIVPASLHTMFGNLPSSTQLFLADPYLRSGTTPTEAHVFTEVNIEGQRFAERCWCFLANSQWLAVGHALRSVRFRSSDLSGSALWNDSAEAQEIRNARWSAAAWSAEVASQIPELSAGQLGTAQPLVRSRCTVCGNLTAYCNCA